VPHGNEFEQDGSPNVPSTDFELKIIEFMQIEKLLHGETFGDDGSNGTRVSNCGKLSKVSLRVRLVCRRYGLEAGALVCICNLRLGNK
jgi:hypothetical protein